MADHFADQYWSTKFWTVNYFQGGEVDLNAMQAALSGAGAVSATLTAAATTTRRGDDGGYARFTGEARRAIYERQLSAIEEQLKTRPRPKKRKQKAEKLRALVIAADEPDFEALSTEIPPLIEQYEAREIGWAALSGAIETQIEQIRREQRRRRNRNIAIAMLMAA